MIVVPPPYSSICIEGGVFGVPPSTALGGTGGAPPTPPTLMRNQFACRSSPLDAVTPRTRGSVQGGPWILAGSVLAGPGSSPDRSGTGPGPVGDRS